MFGADAGSGDLFLRDELGSVPGSIARLDTMLTVVDAYNFRRLQPQIGCPTAN